MSLTASTPRLFTEASLLAGAEVTATEKQAHYLRQVMRRGAGDPVLLFNGRDGEWAAQIAVQGKRDAAFQLLRQSRPQDPLPRVTLAFATLKSHHLDLVIEKATELGVGVLAPIITARTIVTKVKEERLHAIAIEAAEQCERTTVPEIRPAARWGDYIDRLRTAHGSIYFLDEAGARSGAAAPPAAAMDAQAGPVVLVVGPEGGFTPDEAADLRGLAQAKAVSLGRRILRAETAALAALACWQALAGDWIS